MRRGRRRRTGRGTETSVPLQTGSWKINSSGVLGTLSIASVDTAGNVQGTLSSGGVSSPISGFWDEMSAKLTFFATPGTSAIAYTAYLFADQFRMPGITGANVSTLTGYYEQHGGGAGADRFVFAWYAQIGQA